MTEIIRLPCGFANSYLLKGEKGAILVDAGGAGSGQRLARLVRRQGVLPGRLGLVLLTHGHPDHFGGAEYLRGQYGLPLAMHPADLVPGPLLHEGLAGAALLAASRRMVAEARVPKPDVELADGMDLGGFGVEAVVVALPGHTPGSVGVLTPEGEVLAGDLYMNLPLPRTARMAEDFRRLKHSDAALRRRGLSMIYPGHGLPFGPWRLPAAEEEDDE